MIATVSLPNLPPVPPRLSGVLRRTLSNARTMLDTESGIVFVCGAYPSETNPGARDRFMEYAKRRINGFEFFIADKVFSPDLTKSRIDLLSVERILVDYSDCIIMILESASVIAELGAFSAEKKIVQKLLVINDLKFKNSPKPSFITLGPLAKIRARSRFKGAAVLYTDLRSILDIAADVEVALETTRPKNGRRVNLSSFENLRHAHKKDQLLFLRDLVWFYNPLTPRELGGLLSHLYGASVSIDLELEFNLLLALGLVSTDSTQGYWFPSSKHGLFFRYEGIDVVSLRSDIINYYHKNDRDRVTLFKERKLAA